MKIKIKNKLSTSVLTSIDKSALCNYRHWPEWIQKSVLTWDRFASQAPQILLQQLPLQKRQAAYDFMEQIALFTARNIFLKKEKRMNVLADVFLVCICISLVWIQANINKGNTIILGSAIFVFSRIFGEYANLWFGYF